MKNANRIPALAREIRDSIREAEKTTRLIRRLKKAGVGKLEIAKATGLSVEDVEMIQ